jgi:hypothetical protein
LESNLPNVPLDHEAGVKGMKKVDDISKVAKMGENIIFIKHE